MGLYEYKVVPAPAKGRKARGVKKSEDKFALVLQDVMNELAIDGWEFLRSETLPNEERSGLTKTTTTYRSILVFRRSLDIEAAQPAPQIVQEPAETKVEKVMPTRVARPKLQQPIHNIDKNSEESDFFEDADLIPRASNLDNLPAALRLRAQNKGTQKDYAAE